MSSAASANSFQSGIHDITDSTARYRGPPRGHAHDDLLREQSGSEILYSLRESLAHLEASGHEQRAELGANILQNDHARQDQSQRNLCDLRVSTPRPEVRGEVLDELRTIARGMLQQQLHRSIGRVPLRGERIEIEHELHDPGRGSDRALPEPRQLLI